MKIKRIYLNIAIFLFAAILCGQAFAATVTYTHDNLNRLTKIDYGNGTTISYTYDAAGNRQTMTAVNNSPNQYPLSIVVNGNGTVTSTPPGINCPDNCSALYDEDTEVSWTARADSGWVISGLDIEGIPPPVPGVGISDEEKCLILFGLKSPGVTNYSCSFTIDQPKTVTINFEQQDTDNDGIPDSWEIEKFGDLTTADDTTDYDGDGLLDKDESAYNTNPNIKDSDGDSMPDGYEVVNGLDPLINDRAGDINGDGISNWQEYLESINATTFSYDIDRFTQVGGVSGSEEFVDAFNDDLEPPIGPSGSSTYVATPFSSDAENGGMLNLNSKDAVIYDDPSMDIVASLTDNTYFFNSGSGGRLEGKFRFLNGIGEDTGFIITIHDTHSEQESTSLYIKKEASGRIIAYFDYWLPDEDTIISETDITDLLGTCTDITLRLDISTADEVTASLDICSDGSFDVVMTGSHTLNFPEGIEYTGAFSAFEDFISTPTFDATGTWSYSLANNWVNPGNAGCPPGADETDTAVLTQTGNNVTVVIDGITYTGTVSGSTYTFSASHPYSGGAIIKTNTVTLSSDGILGSGTTTWSWSDGANSCNGGADISITKLSLTDVIWVDTVGVNVNDNSITKTASAAWGNGGAASSQSFTGDGGAEFVITQANTNRMFGLSSRNRDANFASIEYAIYLEGTGAYHVYENGQNQGAFGVCQIGDVFRVERSGSAIVYRKNGDIFHTSATPTDSGLCVDVAIGDNGGEISDAKLLGRTDLLTINVPITWAGTVGVTVNGNSIAKTASAAWGNGGAASSQSFTGDGGAEFVVNQANTNRMFGLSSTNLNANWNTIEYAIYLEGTGVSHVIENGYHQGVYGSYQIGDRFKVERVGSTIVYKKNGVIFYTSATSTDSALLVDVAIGDTGGEISDVKLIGITGHPPALDPVSDIYVTEGATVTLHHTANDPDGDTLTYKYSGWMTSPSHTTDINDVGAHIVTVTVSDGSLTDSKDIRITVLNSNLPPELDQIPDIIVSVGETITLNPTSTDPDGDALTYIYSGWMTSASYTTDINDVDTHIVTVTVSDGLLTDSQDVTITVNNAPSQVLTTVPVTWVDLVGVTADGNSITKTAFPAWGNGGAASSQSFTGNGGAEFVVIQADTNRMFGLSSTNRDANWSTIEYAIYLEGTGVCHVFENGYYQGSFGTYQVGDVFRVERVGSAIVYKKNGDIFYTSVTSTDSPLLVDVAIGDHGGEISDVKLFAVVVMGGGQTDTVPVTWADMVGVNVNGNSITKTASAAWGNGGAASSQSFTGNGGAEFVINKANANRMFGLSSTNLDANWNTIEYAIYIEGTGIIHVYESGSRLGNFGPCQAGDSFIVERVGSTIVYKKNGVIFYTSATSTDSALLVDIAIGDTGGEISNVRLIETSG